VTFRRLARCVFHEDQLEMAPEYRPDPKKKYTIAIVGGGIGGLCTAIGLLRQGVPIEIYEGMTIISLFITTYI
jgi:hypothetical protein